MKPNSPPEPTDLQTYRPTNSRALDLLEKARLLFQAEEFLEAAGSYEEALRQNTSSLEASKGLGLSLFRLDRIPQALDNLERAVTGGMEDADVFQAMAICYEHTGRSPIATKALRRAAALQPNSCPLLIRFGRSLVRDELREEALGVLHKVLELDPNSADANDAMALLLPQLGRFEEAKSFARKAMSLDPSRLTPYVRFIYASPFTLGDEALLESLRSLSKKVTPRERVGIEYALGKANEDMERFDDAGNHFLEANRIALQERRRNGGAYDPESHKREIDFIVDTLPKEGNYGVKQNPSDLPIFVIGMMRSGTTLVEQILSSHPEIGAGGEQTFWRDYGPQLHESLTRHRQTSPLEQGAGHYLSRLREIAPNRRHVCDKLPQNYMMAGLIHAVLPKGKFIHCQRDPRDTCLSLFTTPFTFPPPFAHDPATIAFAYSQYSKLMDHWVQNLPPDSLLTVRYEDLIEDREAASKRMIEFLGLEWSPSCLFPEKNTRGLANPSQWQARQPVYSSSIGRWKRFLPVLQSQIDCWNIA